MERISAFPSLLLSTICALGIMTCAANAQTTYNANTDFDSINPNGVWSYGFTATADVGSPFTLYNDYFSSSDFLTWRAEPLVDSNFGKNISGSTLFGVPAGSVALHPGFSNQNAVLRFVVPTAGIYNVSVQFFSGNTGDTDGLILLNGDATNPLFYAATTDSDPLYFDSVSLNSGDIVDILVGSKGSYFSDSTPIDAIFTVPEPSTYALLFLGGAASLWALKRRKS